MVLGAVALFACALLSKSMVVNLPVVLLILDVYPLRRLGGAIGWWSEPARRVYVEKIPFVLLAAVHIIWGTALADRGRLAEASEHYRQALQIQPDHAAAQSNLLNVLRRLGTGKEDATSSRKRVE